MTLSRLSRDHLWRVIGLVLFVFVLSRIDLGETAERVTQARLEFLALAGALTAPLLAVRAWRLQVILASAGIRLSFRQVLTLRIVTSAAGDATPGRLGEFGAVAYLQQAGFAGLNATAGILIDRALDAAVFAFVATGAIFAYPTLLPLSIMRNRLATLPGGFTWLPAAALTLDGRSLRSWIPELLQQSSFDGRQSITALALRLSGAGLLSLLAFGLLVSRAYCLTQALDIPISFFTLAGVVAISTFVQLLPISVLGIGSRDISLLYLFERLGLPASSAVSLSWLVLGMLVLQLALGLAVWWRHPFRLAGRITEG